MKKCIIMDKKDNIPLPENQKPNKQSKKEQAINKKAVDGEKVNDQLQDKRNDQLPRDSA